MCTQKVPYCYMPINIFVIALLKNMNLVCPVIAAFAEISTSFNTKLTHTLITNRYKFFVMLINQTNICHYGRNHTIFRHANFIGCLSADKIKMPVRKYFCFNIPVYRNMAEEPSCRSPYHEEYIQTSVSGNSEGLCRSTYSFLSERR